MYISRTGDTLFTDLGPLRKDTPNGRRRFQVAVTMNEGLTIDGLAARGWERNELMEYNGRVWQITNRSASFKPQDVLDALTTGRWESAPARKCPECNTKYLGGYKGMNCTNGACNRPVTVEL